MKIELLTPPAVPLSTSQCVIALVGRASEQELLCSDKWERTHEGTATAPMKR